MERMILGLFAAILLVTGISYSPKAYAETIAGVVISIDPTGRFFFLARDGGSTISADMIDQKEPVATSKNENPAKVEKTNANETDIKVVVSPNTEVMGFSDLNELKPGDELVLEAKYNSKTEAWEADRIKIDKVDLQV